MSLFGAGFLLKYKVTQKIPKEVAHKNFSESPHSPKQQLQKQKKVIEGVGFALLFLYFQKIHPALLCGKKVKNVPNQQWL